jgi:GT2 family glycosyltransferase
LSPDALFEVVKLLQEQKDLDFLFSDEDKISPAGQLVEPFFKPGWNPDLILSMNYIAHFSVFRRTLMVEAGGFRKGFDGSQDYDLVLRVAERTTRIAHIPKILYHWRKIPGSTASFNLAKPYADDKAKKALEEAVQRRQDAAEVETLWLGRYRVRFAIEGEPLVSIIIPFRDKVHLLKQCLESITERTSYRNYEVVLIDNNSTETETHRYLGGLPERCRLIRYPHPFNFSAINNFAIGHAKGAYLLFLNNDTQVIEPRWIEAMLEHGQRKDVGAVGAKLLYPDGRIQHAGVVVGVGGIAGHAFKYEQEGSMGYFDLVQTVRNCSAVTAACLLMSKEKFEMVGGFDERLKVAFNDVDLCLRLLAKGYRVVYTPFSVLYHHESASRGWLHPPDDEQLMWDRWAELIQSGDPYYNPNLTKTHENWSLRLEG